MLVGLTDGEVRRSAHLVLEDGEVLSGPEAFHALLDRLPAVGSVHRHVGHHSGVQRVVSTLYDAAVAIRGATRCALSPTAPAA